MRFFVHTHALEETFHPEQSMRVCWTCAYPVELTNFWAKNLNRGVILVHHQGKLYKVINILRNCEWLPCVRIEKEVWFVANCPKFDRMERGMSIFAFTEATLW